MIQPCYTTADDYVSALKQKSKIIDTLIKSRRSILMLSSKMGDYWHDSCGDNIQMELVKELEILIAELKNENS